MRFVSVAFVTSLSFLAAAQLGDLPGCAQSCVGSSFDGCQTLDIKCICSNKDLISNLSCCVSKACSASDTQKTIAFALQLCSTYGITVPTIASCPATVSATGTSAASASAAFISASAALSNASSVVSSALSSAASVISSAATVTTTSAQAVSSNVAGHNIGSGAGMGVAVAGLLAIL